MILARAHGRWDACELLKRGVPHVYRETLGSSVEAGRELLQMLGMRAFEARRAALAFERHDRASVDALHTYWGDASYLARARQHIEDIDALLSADGNAFGEREDHAWEGGDPSGSHDGTGSRDGPGT